MERFTRYAVLTIAAACAPQDDTPEAQTVGPPGTEQVITLAVGERRDLPGGILVGVTAVPSDSRCPSNVQCVWAGTAAVTISLHVGSSDTSATINTAVDPKAFSFRGWQVRLQEVSPYPEAPSSIPQGAYKAKLGVGRE